MQNTVLQYVSENIRAYIDVPFFVLPQQEQTKYRTALQGVFGALRTQLHEAQADSAVLTASVDEMITVLHQEPFNEQQFAACAKRIFAAVGNTASEYREIMAQLQRLEARAQPFWVSQEIAAKESARKTPEEVKNHDVAILRTDLQLYGLDYFLYMYTLATMKPESCAQLVYKGQQRLPSLREDALEDDLLKKIAYRLFDAELRHRVFVDYYTYKQCFLALPSEMNAAKSFHLQTVITALQTYCLALVDVSMHYGVREIEYGIYLPYPAGTHLQTIREQLAHPYGTGKPAST